MWKGSGWIYKSNRQTIDKVNQNIHKWMKNTSVTLLIFNNLDHIEIEFYLGHKTQQTPTCTNIKLISTFQLTLNSDGAFRMQSLPRLWWMDQLSFLVCPLFPPVHPLLPHILWWYDIKVCYTYNQNFVAQRLINESPDAPRIVRSKPNRPDMYNLHLFILMIPQLWLCPYLHINIALWVDRLSKKSIT